MQRAHWRQVGGGWLLALSFSGCQKGLKSIAPVGLAPVSPGMVEQWVVAYTPQTPVIYYLHWSYQTDQGAAKGRAAIRVAPPDSLRFDFRGPFGKSGAAVVIGDSGRWARPEGDLRDLLQSAPLFWAALGMPSPPSAQMAVSALETPQRRAWRYASVADTFDFVEYLEAPRRLLAERRRGGRIVGLVDAHFESVAAPAPARVAAAQVDFPGDVASRFSFSVDSVTRTESFGPDVWRKP